MKRLIAFLLLFLLTFLYGPVNSGTAMAAQKDWPKGLTIGSAPMGSTYFVLLSGWGDLISKYLKIPTAVESTGGPAANVILIDRKQIDLGAATNLVLYQGWEGKSWAKGKKIRSARSILPLYDGIFHIYAPVDRGIKSIYDLDGKRVCVGGSGTTPGILGPILWDILGIKPAKKINLGWSDANSGVRDGLIDAVEPLMGIPSPSCVELSSTHALDISSIPEKDIPMVIEKLPLLGKATIPANTYKGQTKDIPTVNVWGYMIASKDLPEDLVYEICKQTIGNIEDLISVHKAAKNIKKLNAINDSVIPLHPGAVRYYEEMGIEIPDRLIPPESK